MEPVKAIPVSTPVKPDKKTRTPRTPETIAKGLLSLPLQDRVNILKQLKASIDEEVEERQNQC